MIRKNQFRILRSTKLGQMVCFGDFARMAGLCVGFHLDTLHGYLFHYDFSPNSNFPLEQQTKLVLTIYFVSPDLLLMVKAGFEVPSS